jgi:hypothetical protein
MFAIFPNSPDGRTDGSPTNPFLDREWRRGRWPEDPAERERERGTRGAGGGGFGGGKRCHQRGDGEQGTRSSCGGCLVDDRGRMLPRLLRMVRSVPSKTNRRPGFLSSPFAYRRHHSRKSRAIRKKKKAKVKSINSICLWACILVSNDYETSNTPNCMQGAFL